MRAIIMGVVCIGLLSLAPNAQAATDASCSAALQSVSAEWDAAGFSVPSKPAQMRVVGRDGRTESGAQVTFMRTQLLLATKECNAGNDSAAMKHIAAVHNLLAPAMVTKAAVPAQ